MCFRRRISISSRSLTIRSIIPFTARGCGEEIFGGLMERHPLYVDPNDALAGRWMFILQRLRPFTSAVSNSNMEMAPVFNYEWLKPIQEKYGIIPGIGKMHHFAPDYQIGLQLGFGGLLDKVRQYARQYPEKAEFYQAEEDVLFGIRCWISRHCG